MADIKNVRIGVQNLTFNDVELGHTDGGCEFSYAPEYTDVIVDAYGNTPADKILMGETVKVKIPLAETTLDVIKTAIPNGTLITDSIDATKKKLTIGSTPGKRLSDQAQELILHPIYMASDDKSLDITIHKAVIVNEISLPFKKDEKSVLEVEFIALIDETKTDGDYLACIGDKTATP